MLRFVLQHMICYPISTDPDKSCHVLFHQIPSYHILLRIVRSFACNPVIIGYIMTAYVIASYNTFSAGPMSYFCLFFFSLFLCQDPTSSRCSCDSCVANERKPLSSCEFTVPINDEAYRIATRTWRLVHFLP